MKYALILALGLFACAKPCHVPVTGSTPPGKVLDGGDVTVSPDGDDKAR